MGLGCFFGMDLRNSYGNFFVPERNPIKTLFYSQSGQTQYVYSLCFSPVWTSGAL
jgi:hypothetical protein